MRLDAMARRTHTPQSPGSAVVLGSATITTGLMAGFFYAYACSVMIGLARTDDRTFVATMQWINATVRNAGFAPAFFGALVLTVVAAAIAVRRREPGAAWVIAAAVLYGAAFVVTFALNVPLNEQLAAAGPLERIGDMAAVRARFEDPWNRWNLVRTGLSTAALAALVTAQLVTSRRTTSR